MTGRTESRSARTAWQRSVTYAAIGATQSDDLVRYPPTGFSAMERVARIGHGDARWNDAWTRLFTWDVQRASGFSVDVELADDTVTTPGYVPVQFDETGAPIAPATVADEELYGPDGSPLLKAGDSATLGVRLGPVRLSAPVRVVYVIDEPNRKGFAYGTLSGHPVRGEEAFMLERSAEGSVWLRVRAFSRPAGALWWSVFPLLRLAQRLMLARYCRVLTGPIGD